MSVVIVTGSAGLVGSETVRWFCRKGYDVIGIDNNMRKVFFGDEASIEWNRQSLQQEFRNYTHYSEDIRDVDMMKNIFNRYGSSISLIVHAAAQPSHDWASSDPVSDFSVNANGTLNLLECFRLICPDAVFIFTSTNKVYGDLPNTLPLCEYETRFELEEGHVWQCGIDETMSIDQSKHSLFGASKVAADMLVQEYGRYFGLKTGVFRGGCLTGPSHSGTKLHGFLSYLMRCCITGSRYFIYGYQGKQVRDNIHSFDLVHAFNCFYENPHPGEVYNIGGSRFSNISMIEAIQVCEEITGKELDFKYVDTNRSGDHIWWISNVNKFKGHYPEWKLTYDCRRILTEIHEVQKELDF